MSVDIDQVKDPVTPLQGIFNHARPGTVIRHTAGAEITPRSSPAARGSTAFNRVEELRLAAATARKADVAIVYVGTTLDVEAEGRDRTTLVLPGNQEELIRTVVAANPRTVVVLMSAGPLAVPWVKDHAGVQLYLRPPPSRVARPAKELRGFERINLRPDEHRRVSFAVPADRLAFYDETAHRFEVAPGFFQVMVGSSAEDIRLQGRFTVR